MQTQSESTKALAEGLAKAKAKFKVAKQSGRNPFFKSQDKKDGSHFSTMADIDEACSAALSAEGFAPVTVQPLVMDGQMVAYGVLRHKSGEWIAGYIPLINAKGDMQGLKSAMTYAQRMLTISLTGCVSGEDDDGNGTVGATDANKAQVKAMEAMAAMREAAEANDETKARKVLAHIRLREGEKALPKGTVDRAQQMFDDAFAEATNAA